MAALGNSPPFAPLACSFWHHELHSSERLPSTGAYAILNRYVRGSVTIGTPVLVYFFLVCLIISALLAAIIILHP